jgi:effector-binding domain-containing protein
MNTKIKWSIITILIVFLGWYFLIKQSDYIISFKAKAATGTISQGMQEWASNQNKAGKESVTVLDKKGYESLQLELLRGNNKIEYNCEITSINDSVSQVNVGIKEIGHSFYNRITAPFIDTPFKKEQIAKVTDFKNGLEQHLKAFKVKIEGEGTSKSEFVAYITLTSIMSEKAQKMIGNDPNITIYLQKNNIKIIGHPYVEITNWDRDKETLTFNYCFPVSKNTVQIADPNVKYKTIPALKGLKATYYGNFRTSDRAWFALLDYAKRNNIQLENKVLENFLANPFNGGNELEWETKIIIPFASK